MWLDKKGAEEDDISFLGCNTMAYIITLLQFISAQCQDILASSRTKHINLLHDKNNWHGLLLHNIIIYMHYASMTGIKDKQDISHKQ